MNTRNVYLMIFILLASASGAMLMGVEPPPPPFPPLPVPVLLPAEELPPKVVPPAVPMNADFQPPVVVLQPAADTPSVGMPSPPVAPGASVPTIIAKTVVDEFPFYTNDHTLGNWRKYLEDGGDVEKPDGGGASALMHAAASENVALCELLLKHGADVNYQRPNDKITPLMWAVNGNKAVCELLLKHGAKLDAVDENGNTAFHHLQRAQEDVLQLLLDAGVDINLRNEKDGDTLLIRAVRHSPDMVRMLLKKKPDVNLRNNRGDSPLHPASHYTTPEQGAEIIQMLLDAGADVNAQNNNGETPLYQSVCRYDVNMPVFEALLKAGADVNLGPEEHYRSTPLDMALEHGHAETAMKLLDAGADITQRKEHGAIPLFLAAKTWSRPLMERLIKMGADIQEVNSPAQETVLMYVAEVGDVETAKWLIEEGVDMNARSRWGKTAVMRALECRQDEMVRFLVAQGADLTEGDPEQQSQRGGYAGQLPLQSVVERGDVEMVRLLVKHGARFTDEQRDQKKLLHCAVQSGSVEMCEYVLNFDPDVNVRDYAGNTPLHGAAGMRNYDLCVLLLSRGARVNAKNNNSSTPLMQVVMGGQNYSNFADGLRELMGVRVWQLLVDAGAELDAKDSQEKTVMDYVWESSGLNFASEWTVPVLAAPFAPSSDGRVIGVVDDSSGQLVPRSFLVKYIEATTGKWRNAETPESLFMAAHEGDKERVTRLLEAGQDVNRRDRDGETLLHFAVRAGNAEMVKFLLDKGADMKAQAIHGGTPLHYAAALGQREILELLMEKGAVVNLSDTERNDGSLLWAVAASQGPCVIALVKKGADPGLFGSTYSPFTLALKMRKEAYCKFFCQNGFQVDSLAKKWNFHMFYDAVGLTPENVRVLLECGMDVNSRDNSGMTLLHYAVNRQEGPLIALLMKLGADPSVKNQQEKTPADLVKEMGGPWFVRRQMEELMKK